MPIVSISLTSKILKDIERLTEDRGYFSRSEAIRDAIRNILLEHKLSILADDIVFATVIVAYDIERGDLENKISKLNHEWL